MEKGGKQQINIEKLRKLAEEIKSHTISENKERQLISEGYDEFDRAEEDTQG